MFNITGLFWSFMISETFNKTIVFIKGGIQMYKKTIEEVVNSLDTKY